MNTLIMYYYFLQRLMILGFPEPRRESRGAGVCRYGFYVPEDSVGRSKCATRTIANGKRDLQLVENTKKKTRSVSVILTFLCYLRPWLRIRLNTISWSQNAKLRSDQKLYYITQMMLPYIRVCIYLTSLSLSLFIVVTIIIINLLFDY